MTEMPSSPEAEEIILSSILFWPNDAPATFSQVPDEHFYDPTNGAIYRTLRAMQESGIPLELLSLTERLRQNGRLEKIGGPSRLSEINNHIPVAQSLPHYRRILAEKHHQRTLVQIMNSALQTWKTAEDGSEWISGTLQKISELEVDHAQRPAKGWNELVNGALDRYEAMMTKTGPPGIPTGLPTLDRMTGGLLPRKMWVIGGGTGDGKSALGEQICIHAATKGEKVGIYSLEMDEEEIVDRAFALYGAPEGVMTEGFKDRNQIRQTVSIASQMQKLQIIVRDVSGIKLRSLLADIAAMARKGVRVFMVDYGQLIESDGDRRSREEEVAAMSRSLKNLAKRTESTIILLSQLNDDGKMRESRAIAMDADVVITMSTPLKEERIDGQKVTVRENNKRTLFLGKVRRGRRDEPIKCWYHGSQFRFEEMR